MDYVSLSMDELTAIVEELGEKKFRAGQIYDWIHRQNADSFEEMTNVPKKLRDALKEKGELVPLEVADRLTSKIDETSKFLFRLSDGNVIESVLMKYEHGYSVCISSQVGCKMGCRFCASTIGGKLRNLTAGEMLAQIYKISKVAGVKISSVVVMGTGEPLDNYDNLLRFISLLTDEKGMNLSNRAITVSTCGLVPEIRRLADEKLQITLAISLHAPNDELRKTIMPVAFTYDIKSLMEACDYYFEQTGRRITFEYSLMAEVNDTKECGLELIRLISGKNCHVNLIPVNPVKERSFRRGNSERILAFKNLLEKNRINVTIRREMGSDIDAACGQLRRSYEEKSRLAVTGGSDESSDK